MNRNKTTLLVAVLFGAIALAAQAQAPTYPIDLLSGTSHPRAAKTDGESLPATAYATKAPVALSWRLAEAPQVGQPVAINLDFRALAGLSAQVQLSGEEGLEVQASDFAIGYRARGEHWSTQVLVTPTLASRRYLNVVVATLDDTGARRMRGFAVPVVVDPGSVRAKAGVRVSTDSHGVAVRSMPAREEILATP